MKKKITLIISVVLVVLIFTGVYFLYGKLSENYADETTAQNTTALGQTQTAPDFTVLDVDSNVVKLSDYFGKPIVINFWATWCPYCIEEMPLFEEAYKENYDVQFLMINCTAGDTMSKAKAFIDEQKYTFPVLYDAMGNASQAYSATSLPVTYFIDKDGKIVSRSVGMMSEEKLKEKIDLLKG